MSTVASEPGVLRLSLLSQFGIVQSAAHDSSEKNELELPASCVSVALVRTGGCEVSLGEMLR